MLHGIDAEQELRSMLDWGIKQGKSHMIICFDRAEVEELVFYASGESSYRSHLIGLKHDPCVVITDVFDLCGDIETQLEEYSPLP